MPYWIISCFKLSIKINNSRTPQSDGWEINNQGSFLLTCFNFNPSVEKKLHPPVQVHIEINRFLTHWGRVTHICDSKLITIGSDNGLSPGRHQTNIWTNAGILLIGPLATKFCEFLIEIHTFSFTKMQLKMSSVNCWSFCLGLNVSSENKDFDYLCHPNAEKW